MYYLGVKIDLDLLVSERRYRVASELQQATVEFVLTLDGDIVARHCGFGKGCFFTDFTTIAKGVI